MLYPVLKVLMRTTVKVYYKNIYIRNLDKVPTDKPLILTSNHPSAFMDAIVLSVFMKQELHYLVRSDVFNTPFKRWILGQLNQIPIYRIQEGADQLHRNKETFERCNKILNDNKTILIFSEGICVQEKRLRKLKKGTARIAFSAETGSFGNLGLLITPVGINYSQPSRFRSDLVIDFGDPFPVSNYFPLYQQDPAKGVNALTRKIETELEKQLVIVKHPINDYFFEELIDLYKTYHLTKLNKLTEEDDYQETRKIAAALNNTYDADPEKIDILKARVTDYKLNLDKLNLRDNLFLKPANIRNPLFSALLNCLILAVTFPFLLFGLLGNYLPYKLPYRLTKKIVKHIEFFASVNLASGTFMFLIYYLILVFVFAQFSPSTWLTLVFIVSLPYSGFYSLFYYRKFRKTIGLFNLYNLHKSDPVKYKKLFAQREQLFNNIEEMINS